MRVRRLPINLAFLAALLLRFPTAAFAALSTRGDGFLEGRTEGVATARALLFDAARGLEWLYDAKHENPYARYIARSEILSGPRLYGDYREVGEVEVQSRGRP